MAGLQAENWFREKIKDLIIVKEGLTGGYLDGTMIGGDEGAGTYKFPVFGGKIETVELSGAIEDVSADTAELTTITMKPTDYEAATWYREQDLYKMGPSHQSALADEVTYSINNRKDSIKWKALYDFTADAGNQDIGGDAVVIDPRLLGQARAQIAAAGHKQQLGNIVCPLPYRAFEQLNQYKEWANADVVGADNLPFSKAALEDMRRIRGVYYFALPDEFFTFGGTGDGWFETFMWAYNALGAETPWNKLPPSMDQVPTKAGSPWLIKAQVGGCAVGLRRKAAKKLRFKANQLPERIPQLTQAAA